MIENKNENFLYNKKVILGEYGLSDDFKVSNYYLKRLNELQEIIDLLIEFDNEFNPPLICRINNYEEYAKKLWDNAFVYIAFNDAAILGFIAIYANDYHLKTAYIAQIAIHRQYQNKRIATTLIKLSFEIAKREGMKKIKLEVWNNNDVAIRFYKRNGFVYFSSSSEKTSYMMKNL